MNKVCYKLEKSFAFGHYEYSYPR